MFEKGKQTIFVFPQVRLLHQPRSHPFPGIWLSPPVPALSTLAKFKASLPPVSNDELAKLTADLETVTAQVGQEKKVLKGCLNGPVLLPSRSPHPPGSKA